MEYVADAHVIFEHFSPLEPVSVIGHSLGGGVISAYAGVYPERVRHFINLEGFLFPFRAPEEGPQRVKKWIEKADLLSFPVHQTLKRFSERLMASNPRLSSEKALFLARHLTRKVRGGYQMSADPKHKLPEPYLHLEKTFFPFWKNIQAKTLLVSADQTEMKKAFPARQFQATSKRRQAAFPKSAQKVTLENCGHMMHQERPEELAEKILEFIKGFL